MRFEIEVLRQNTCANQFFLQNLHKIQKILRLSSTYIIYSIWRNGQSILTLLALRSPLHHTNNTLYDVIHISKITPAVTIVKDLDGFTLNQLIRKPEIRHIRTTCRTIHRKESQPRRRNIIQFRIAVRHEFIALLSRSIERYRVIHPIISRERHLLIASIHTRRRSIHQMLHRMISTSLQDVIKPYHVTLDIRIRIRNRIPHPRLCRQIHHHLRFISLKYSINRLPRRYIPLNIIIGNPFRFQPIQLL